MENKLKGYKYTYGKDDIEGQQDTPFIWFNP